MQNTNTKKTLITAFILIIIGGGIFLVISNNLDPDPIDQNTNTNNQNNVQTNTRPYVVDENGNPVNSQDDFNTQVDQNGNPTSPAPLDILTTVPSATASVNKLTSKYRDYSEAALNEATQQGTALLFFYASWCPTCRAAEQDIVENFEQLPENLTILKVDYDTEDELKNKYGIVNQHTFVQVDSAGNIITKWLGGGTETILDNIIDN